MPIFLLALGFLVGLAGAKVLSIPLLVFLIFLTIVLNTILYLKIEGLKDAPIILVYLSSIGICLGALYPYIFNL